MIKLLIKTAVHIPCHKCSYHSSKNTASSLHSLLKWVVLGLNSGSLKNAAPLSSASRHLRRNQCILEQTKVTGPPTNFHIVDFMSSVSSTIVSAPTGGRCLVVVEKLLPLKLRKEFVTMYHVFVWELVSFQPAITHLSSTRQPRGVHCTKHVRVYVNAQKGY